MIKRLCGTTLAAVAILAVSGTARASGLEFEARLTGAQEVPAVDTTQTGSFEVEFDSGFTRAEFKLHVFNGVAVTQAHFHCHRAGQNGPVVAFLYGFGPAVDVDGLLSQGTLTNASFTGADCVPSIGRPINNIASLAMAIRDGLIYVNVHTVAHPPGETRGQVLAARDDGSGGNDDDSDNGDHDSDSHDHGHSVLTPKTLSQRPDRDR